MYEPYKIKFSKLTEQAYAHLKDKKYEYIEEYHCRLILEIMSDPYKGTISAFCKEALISDKTFYRWKNKYELFDECYRLGCMISRENWEEDGRNRESNESFNLEYWRIIGSSRYGVGKSNRVRLELSEDSTPYDQYKQLISQASLGDFTASEIKQLMESLNAGTRAYETFELQKEIDNLKKDLALMEQNNNGDNSFPNKAA